MLADFVLDGADALGVKARLSLKAAAGSDDVAWQAFKDRLARGIASISFKLDGGGSEALLVVETNNSVQTQIRDLTTRAEAAEARAQEATVQLAAVELERETLQAAHSELGVLLASTQAERDQLVAELADTRIRLDNAQANVVLVQEQRDALSLANASLHDQLADASATHDRLQADLRISHEARREAEALAADLQVRLNEAVDAMALVVNDKATLTLELAATQAERDQHVATISTLRGERDALAAGVLDLRARLEAAGETPPPDPDPNPAPEPDPEQEAAVAACLEYLRATGQAGTP